MCVYIKDKYTKSFRFLFACGLFLRLHFLFVIYIVYICGAKFIDMENRYIKVQYKLYAPMGEEKEVRIIEETRDDMPFDFISGMNMVLDSLEQQLVPLSDGQDFRIELSEDEAYGPYIPEGVQEIPAEAFFVEGKMDDGHVYEGAVVPLRNAEGEQFNGTVVKITDKTVVVDLNHPLAGKQLTFQGRVIENRIATNKEIESYLNAQGGCGSCGGCGGGGCNGCGGCN